MNDGITHFLNQYIESNAPRYAVLLKGAWGSGKSYFIRKWMKSLEGDAPEAEDDVVLKPIYVSLYGLGSAAEIHEAIRKELYPIFYSKGAKIVTTLVKGFSMLTLKGDNLEGTIDLISLFANEDKRIKGRRLLIFDDFERARMDARECMGCINYYVEQCGCKVIIISHEDKIPDKDGYIEIKEKTVGREFEIVPDIDAALESFLHGPEGVGTDDVNRLEEFRPLIVDIFRCAGTNNLRVLRQALMDYDAIVRDLDAAHSVKDKRQYPEILRLLLGNLFAIYLEYKSGNRAFENWKETVMKKPDGAVEPTAFVRKYNTVSTLSEPLFRFAWVEKVMDYLKRGTFDIEFLHGLFARKYASSWAQLDNFLSLESEEFSKLVDTAWKSLKGRKITDISEVLHADYNLLRILKEELPVAFDEEDIIEQTIKYFQRDLRQIGNEQELMEYRRKFFKQFQYYQSPHIQQALDKIKDEFAKLVQERAVEVKNPLALALENISDATISEVESLLDKTVPDQSSLYDDSAIFAVVDPLKFAGAVEKMSNSGRQELQAVLQRHYRSCLGIANAAAFIQRYYADVEVLKQVAYCLDASISVASGLDRANLRRFQITLLEFAEEMEDIEFKRALRSGEEETVAAMVDEPFTQFTSTAGLTDYEIIFELWRVASGKMIDSKHFCLEPDNRSYGGKWLKRLDSTAMIHMTPNIAGYFPKWLEGHIMGGVGALEWYNKKQMESGKLDELIQTALSKGDELTQ